MADVVKLKKRAAEFELKKQFDKALATYVEILQSYGKKGDDEVDLALYNRVGDLYLKQGNVADAVDYYEQAVDRYAEGGFFNNAIALCNKILRSAPGRASVYYKLGRISALKGFKGDAKANFLEYADRMQQAGKIDEAFRALKEFADLCPDQDDIRLLLADQLTKKGRGPEAVEQLQTLYERYTQEGRSTEARATMERMQAIDPSSQPRAAGDAPRRVPGDLVFLDLGDSGAAPAVVAPAAPPAPRPAPPRPAPPKVPDEVKKRATQGLDIIDPGDDPAPPPPLPPAPVRAAAPPPVAPPVIEPEPVVEPEPVIEIPDEVEMVELDLYDPGADADPMAQPTDFGSGGGGGSLLEGLETTSFDASDDVSSGSLLDFEPTSFGEPEPPAPAPRPAAPAPRPAAPAPRPAAAQGAPPAPPKPVAPAAAPPRPPAAPAAPVAAADDLLDFEMPDQRSAGPREVAPREVLRQPVPPAAASRPSFDDLPMIDADSGADAGDSYGGDLQLIMPDADADGGGDALDDIPLMDLELPTAGEATRSITGAPAIEAIDFSASGFEVDVESLAAAEVEQAVELSPAEIDVRAELELDEAPIARQPTGSQAAVRPAAEPSGDYEAVTPAPRRSTIAAAQSVELLQAGVEGDPQDHVLRRRLGEAMLESGNREGGIQELETAMIGFEREDDLSSAASIADEIVLLNPGSVRHHQKRVEYAFRTNERGRLIEAYLQLADALFRADQVDKSRAIYQRVIDLSPDDLRANAALQSFPAVEEPAPAPPPPVKGRQSVGATRPAPPPPKPKPVDDGSFVNLGDWLRDDEGPKDTRMIVEEQEPSGDEEADFQDMLRKFKQGVAENIEDEDHQSHYDLGVAFKEMGLIDEAIAEFQKALRAPTGRASTYEALGQCFVEREQYPMAATILGRALAEKGAGDDQLVGVLYLLGVCAEMRGQYDLALEYYQRVFVVDIQFRDVGDRLAAVEGAL